MVQYMIFLFVFPPIVGKEMGRTEPRHLTHEFYLPGDYVIGGITSQVFPIFPLHSFQSSLFSQYRNIAR